ncbi:hypothetical protein T05_1924 [Trichinella murrelli]|uniref:Uncharacterized protein n=1 Tax=Trichinella murrelli TaxID=144512 RepID=A0A0V0U8L9_9BILA|nr:hypothetical protein T05_1924 [Trichinella murrelli]
MREKWDRLLALKLRSYHGSEFKGIEGVAFRIFVLGFLVVKVSFKKHLIEQMAIEREKSIHSSDWKISLKSNKSQASKLSIIKEPID